jgi:hypothetical protein
MGNTNNLAFQNSDIDYTVSNPQVYHNVGVSSNTDRTVFSIYTIIQRAGTNKGFTTI